MRYEMMIIYVKNLILIYDPFPAAHDNDVTKTLVIRFLDTWN